MRKNNLLAFSFKTGLRILLTTGITMLVPVLAEDRPKSDANYEKAVKEMCSENAAPVKRAKGTQVFSWKDENGQVHFGDRPPANTDVQTETLQGRKDYFDMEITFPSGAIRTGIDDALQVNGAAIVYAMGRLIPADRMSKSSIEMKIFNSHTSFLGYKKLNAPSLSNNVAGFYSVLNNSVAVWHNGDDEYAQEIALHEATHVFQSKNIGFMPGWLTEGLAEYFSFMRVQGKAKVVRVSPYWNWYFKSTGRKIPLNTLLTASYGNWQSSSAGDFYGNSWAFVYFMMLPENRRLMASYLDDLSKNKCDEMAPNHSLVFFEENYRGGVNQLQKDWLAWFSSSHDVPNYH